MNTKEEHVKAYKEQAAIEQNELSKKEKKQWPEDSEHMRFARRLSELLSKKRISAHGLSLDIGMSGSYINGVEAGNFLPAMDVFFLICEQLDISSQEFFQYDKDPYLQREFDIEMKKLTQQSQKNLLTFLQGL